MRNICNNINLYDFIVKIYECYSVNIHDTNIEEVYNRLEDDNFSITLFKYSNRIKYAIAYLAKNKEFNHLSLHCCTDVTPIKILKIIEKIKILLNNEQIEYIFCHEVFILNFDINLIGINNKILLNEFYNVKYYIIVKKLKRIHSNLYITSDNKLKVFFIYEYTKKDFSISSSDNKYQRFVAVDYNNFLYDKFEILVSYDQTKITASEEDMHKHYQHELLKYQMTKKNNKIGINYIGVGVCVVISRLNESNEIEYLLCLRGDDCASEKYRWEFPGGAVEYGETIMDAAKREVFEELNILIHINNEYPIILDNITKNGHLHWVSAIFFATLEKNSIPKIMEKNKCVEIKWLKLDEMRGYRLTTVADKVYIKLHIDAENN